MGAERSTDCIAVISDSGYDDKPIELHRHNGRLVIVAYNQGGYDCTEVDLGNLLEWLNRHPAILAELKV